MAAAELLDHEQLPSPSSPTSQPHIQHELRSRPPPRPPMNSPTGNLPPHLLSQPRLPIVAAMGDGRIIGVRSHPKPTKIDLLTALVCARRHVDFVLLENERADYNAVVELVVEAQGDTSNEIKLERTRCRGTGKERIHCARLASTFQGVHVMPDLGVGHHRRSRDLGGKRGPN